MTSKRIAGTSLALLFLGSVFVAGCAKPPSEEIDAASAAMDAAQSAEAPVYAPESWAMAQEAEAQLEAELVAEEQAFALSRSYDKAKSLAEAAKAAADKAAADAVSGREVARSEATQTIEQAKALRLEVQTLLERAPQGKGTVADLAALRADTGSTEEMLRAAETALDGGQYVEARAKAEAAIQALDKVKAEIESARQARGGRA